MPCCRPRDFTRANFSGDDEVPYISMPRSWPIWTAAVPTPPATAWIRTQGVRGGVGESKSPPCRRERDKDGAPVARDGAPGFDCEAALRSDGWGARPHTGT